MLENSISDEVLRSLPEPTLNLKIQTVDLDYLNMDRNEIQNEHENNDEVEEEPVNVFTQKFVKIDMACKDIETSDKILKADDQRNYSIIVSETRSGKEPKNIFKMSSASAKSFVGKTPTESDNIKCEVEKCEKKAKVPKTNRATDKYVHQLPFFKNVHDKIRGWHALYLEFSRVMDAGKHISKAFLRNEENVIARCMLFEHVNGGFFMIRVQ